MIVIDYYGLPMEVADLSAALKQAADFKEFRHMEPGWEEFDRERQAYWSDLHHKIFEQIQNKH